MTRAITIDGIDGSLEINEDGELVYARSGLETEVLNPDQAIERWPSAANQIRQALDNLE